MVIDDNQMREVRERKTYRQSSVFGPALGESAANLDVDSVDIILAVDEGSGTASYLDEKGHVFVQIEDPDAIDTKSVLDEINKLLDITRGRKTKVP